MAFRQAFQKRADASLVKTFNFKDKYTFDVYNLTNTTCFDVPDNEVAQDADYNPFPAYPNSGPGSSTRVLHTGCGTPGASTTSFYACPPGLGIVTHTIGTPRQMQMSLHFDSWLLRFLNNKRTASTGLSSFLL